MLRGVADAGVLVSAHPDTILRMGTKDVLVETRDLPFGSDVHRIDSLRQLQEELPLRLRDGARVLKQHRGHSGAGVWRVELADPAAGTVRLRHAQRGSEETVVSFDTLARTMAPYFDAGAGGHMIDQAWQPRLVDGMVRAYMVADRVGGFGHQAVNALYPARGDQPAPAAGPRLYHGADDARFQDLKARLESGWIEHLRACVGVPQERLAAAVGHGLHPGRAVTGRHAALRAVRNQRQQRVAVSAVVHRAADGRGPSARTGSRLMFVTRCLSCEVHMMYSIAPLFCRPWTLNGIPARLIESHYENNYGSAVRRLNALTGEIHALDPATTAPEALRRLKRDEFALLNSTLLHEVYFASLGGDGRAVPAGPGRRADSRFRIGRALARASSSPWRSRCQANRAGSC